MGFASINFSNGVTTERMVFHVSVMNCSHSLGYEDQIEAKGLFGAGDGFIFFPLWYASLVCVLAAIGALRLGRRFTLRSTIIVMTITAGLLGMAAAM